MFMPTLREVPAEAVVASHRLLLRANPISDISACKIQEFNAQQGEIHRFLWYIIHSNSRYINFRQKGSDEKSKSLELHNPYCQSSRMPRITICLMQN